MTKKSKTIINVGFALVVLFNTVNLYLLDKRVKSLENPKMELKQDSVKNDTIK